LQIRGLSIANTREQAIYRYIYTVHLLVTIVGVGTKCSIFRSTEIFLDGNVQQVACVQTENKLFTNLQQKNELNGQVLTIAIVA